MVKDQVHSPKSLSPPPLPSSAFWKFFDLGSPYLVLVFQVLLRYAKEYRPENLCT